MSFVLPPDQKLTNFVQNHINAAGKYEQNVLLAAQMRICNCIDLLSTVNNHFANKPVHGSVEVVCCLATGERRSGGDVHVQGQRRAIPGGHVVTAGSKVNGD